jgi:O-acetyl-ADP-ribose deacetylase (regulator of RNase III)
MPRLSLQLGDITMVDAEAIATSCSEDLVTGGPVHAAVHKAAGPALMEACRTLGSCPPGQARLTPGFALRARHVLHVVLPLWQGGDQDEMGLLADGYRSALALAEEKGLGSVAFPSMGAGLQPQYPLEAAARVALHTVQGFLDRHTVPERVILVCFDPPTFQAYQKELRAMLP